MRKLARAPKLSKNNSSERGILFGLAFDCDNLMSYLVVEGDNTFLYSLVQSSTFGTQYSQVPKKKKKKLLGHIIRNSKVGIVCLLFVNC